MGEDPDTIRDEIADTRERMGDTIDALGYKADVKSRAKDNVAGKVDSVKESLGLAGQKASVVRINSRGRGNYAREVHDIFVTDPFAERIMVGETFNPAGHWSSYPPHKHDGKDGEPVLEEVYYFRIDPPQGFGQQMLYTADGESVCHVVRDGDAVLLPYGYHPVSSPPGYRLYYLWAMAGGERRLALHEDPAHRWIHEGTTP